MRYPLGYEELIYEYFSSLAHSIIRWLPSFLYR